VPVVSAGGDLSLAAAYATSLPFVRDMAVTADNRLFASVTGKSGVYEITGGGDFASASAFATGQNFFGLAVDGDGRLLAIPANSNRVFDITSGGDFSAAAPFAFNLPIAGETPLDTVPLPPPAGPTHVTLDGLSGVLVVEDAAAGGKDDRLTFTRVGTALRITDLDGLAIDADSVPAARPRR
jgi:hypothetical protein